jgi:putative ABC transport system ATP-binding protein
MDTAIAVRRVTKTYSEGAAAVRALDEVDLDVEHGEVTLLMGPSGSGKTTLLSIMGCILRPSSGSVRIAGHDVTTLGERALPKVRLDHIGFIFQGFNLFPALSAEENVVLALNLKGLKGQQARRRAAELLKGVGLEEKSATYPANLSGGQKQRVAIARALAVQPEILLADEPTASLDSRSGRAVLEMLRGLAHGQGCAVVIVTHDSRAMEFADRIVRIQDGRVATDDEEEGAAGRAAGAFHHVDISSNERSDVV